MTQRVQFTSWRELGDIIARTSKVFDDAAEPAGVVTVTANNSIVHLEITMDVLPPYESVPNSVPF